MVQVAPTDGCPVTITRRENLLHIRFARAEIQSSYSNTFQVSIWSLSALRDVSHFAYRDCEVTLRELFPGVLTPERSILWQDSLISLRERIQSFTLH